MKIYVTMKSLSKKKALLQSVEFQLSKKPETISDLISELVSINVRRFNESHGEDSILHYLTKQEIEERAVTGKVGLGASYNEHKADFQASLQTALQAFADGLFKVFINDVEQGVESPSIHVKEGDQVVFIKLTMLAGRMW